MSGVVAVLDVGKTHAKLSLVREDGTVSAVRSRANLVRRVGSIRVLDTDGIERWLTVTLTELARDTEIAAIVPVAHGATAAFITAPGLAAPVMDYETPPPDQLVTAYRALRDPFEKTLSPPLPLGLNLGLQLFWQEKLTPDLWPARANVLPWPQYWAYWLCGNVASEVSSLGCHTDLWYPREKTFSDMAKKRGWDRRFAGLAKASAVIGTIRPALAELTGLPRSCEILCGLHDSNASLIAARRIMTASKFSLVSTGTWFIAFQSGGGANALDPTRDTLGNVDIDGNVVPAARFMGGREYETILGDAIGATATADDAARIVARGAMARPAFVPDSGPFPKDVATREGEAHTPGERAALASLYLALMQDVSLDLIGAEGPLLIEGRFASDPIFPAALARLRPGQPVHRCAIGDGIALGAASLKHAAIKAPVAEPVAPLAVDLAAYKARWIARD